MLATISLDNHQEHASPLEFGVVYHHFVKVCNSHIYFDVAIFFLLFHFTVVDCRRPVTTNHMFFGGLKIAVHNTTFNSTAMYSCMELGYTLVGDSSRACQANGYWSGEEPYCNTVLHGTVNFLSIFDYSG